jgi:hypothetical protein
VIHHIVDSNWVDSDELRAPLVRILHRLLHGFQHQSRLSHNIAFERSTWHQMGGAGRLFVRGAGAPKGGFISGAPPLTTKDPRGRSPTKQAFIAVKIGAATGV